MATQQTQDLVKDLISTVEKKVSGPLSQTQGALTQGLVDTPGQVRSALNVGGPAVSNAQLFGAIEGRTSPIIGGITATNALQASSTSALSSFFTGLTSLAKSEISSARQPNFDIITTAEGLRAFDPSTGKFVGGILGQAPSELTATERSNALLNQVYADLRDDIQNGNHDLGQLSIAYPELTAQQIEEEVEALKDTRGNFQKFKDFFNPFQ